METVLCAAVDTARHQHALVACTVCEDRTVCSCRHSKSSAWVRSMYCVCSLYFVQLQTQQDISMCQKQVLCAAVGTGRYQHGLEVCTAYGDRTLCTCRHSKTSAWVRSMYCVCRPYCVQMQAQQVISMWASNIYCVWQSCTEPICTNLTGNFLKSFI